MMVRCIFGGLLPRSGLARHSRGSCPRVSQPVAIRASLTPPHFSIDRSTYRRTLAVDIYIDIVEHNWSGNARLRTPLQGTVIQRKLPPRWPQLSQIAWVSEKVRVFNTRKRRFPATLTKPVPAIQYLITVGRAVPVLTTIQQFYSLVLSNRGHGSHAQRSRHTLAPGKFCEPPTRQPRQIRAPFLAPL